MRKVELLPTRDCEAGYGPARISLWNFNTENHTENFRVTLKIHEIAQDKGIE